MELVGHSLLKSDTTLDFRPIGTGTKAYNSSKGDNQSSSDSYIRSISGLH